MTAATNNDALRSAASPGSRAFVIAPALAHTWGDTAFLDGLRGLAAVYVLLHHAVFLLQAVPVAPRWVRVLSLLAVPLKMGHAAVIFFFVLSGFVVHLRYARQIRKEGSRATFGWGKFVYRRARRLYPPLLLAVAITAGCDWLGVRLGYNHLFAAMRSSAYAWIEPAMQSNHHWTTLLGNLAFLTQMHVPFWGTDSPLWSLAYEWWFYMLYPLLWVLSRRSVWLATGVVAGLFVLSRWPGGWPVIEGGARPFTGADALFLPRKVLTALPAWWCGALLADAYADRIRISPARIAPLALAPLLLAIPSLGEAVRTLILGLGFTGLMAFFFAIRNAGWRLAALDRLQFLASMAYTLYVIHMPIAILICGWIAARGLGNRSIGMALALLLISAIPLGIAWFTSLLVERPFTRVPARPATQAAR